MTGRARPGRSTPPRDQASLQEGLLIASHGRHYEVEFADGTVRQCYTRGKKGGAAVGDRVQVGFQGDQEGVIESTSERRNLLYRSDEQRSKQFAANVDQLVIVVAVVPTFSDDLTGRALTGAWSAEIDPVVVLNKIDIDNGLQAARTRLAPIRALGVPIFEVSATHPETLEALRLQLQGKTSLLLGQSGMGKSTLLNVLCPDARAHTQEHSVALDMGRHTTTNTRLYHLPDRTGDLIDSPGFQSFGLMHLDYEDIVRGFPEFRPFIEKCRYYNCKHRHEPGCGVLAALEAGEIDPARHALYVRMLDESEEAARPGTASAAQRNRR